VEEVEEEMVEDDQEQEAVVKESQAEEAIILGVAPLPRKPQV
jgi:hypothetical protein